MSAKGFFLIVIILITASYCAITVPAVPITVQEPYAATETYQEQEPYTVRVPYSVDVQVTRSLTVTSFSCGLGLLTFETEDFSLTTGKQCKISWSSSQEVNLFAIMTDDAWDSFYQNLIIKLGLPAVLTLYSGGTLAPITVTFMVTVLPDIVNILSDENYYIMNSKGRVLTKYFNPGSYKIVVIGTSVSGSLNANISYDYQTTETQTRYRDETRYKTVSKTRTVTRYRDVTKQVTLLQFLQGQY